MAKLNPLPIFIIFLLSPLTLSTSGISRKLQTLERKLDSVTNPANFPPYTPTPTIVTVPASNPTTPFASAPPTTTSVPATTTTPSPPITNPANSGNVPTTAPPSTAGQSWCVANSGASETALQSGLDYACGSGLADCSSIQEGGSCYNPNSLANHASYAFNSYFQKNPSSTSCDFGGAASLVNTNPSTGSCIYPSSAGGTGAGSGTAMPLSNTPTETPSSTFPTPPTTSSPGTTGFGSGSPASGNYGSPPSLTNSGNPNSLFPASYGPDSPPLGNSLPAGSSGLRPDISFVILVALFFTGRIILIT